MHESWFVITLSKGKLPEADVDYSCSYFSLTYFWCMLWLFNIIKNNAKSKNDIEVVEDLMLLWGPN